MRLLPGVRRSQTGQQLGPQAFVIGIPGTRRSLQNLEAVGEPLEMLATADAFAKVLADGFLRGRFDVVADQQGCLSFRFFALHGDTFSSVDDASPWRFAHSR